MNSQKLLRRHLCILDVGHGNCAVLIASEANVVIVDVGQQSAVSEFLLEQQITHVQSIYLSHADADHVGALVGIIATGQVTIDRVILNSDSSKGTKVWEDLIYELDVAHRSGALEFEVSLVSGNTEQVSDDVRLEVLGPSRYLAAKGVGSVLQSGTKIRSNSISAVISIIVRDTRLAILPGDLDGVGLTDLQDKCEELLASILVYPHHGGLPGGMDPIDFGTKLLDAVSPDLVVFSIGRGSQSTPNADTVRMIRTKQPETRVICTQLSKHCSKQLPGSLPLHLSPAFAQGRNEGKCCGGTVVVPLDDVAAVLPLPKLHADFIRLSANEALCAPV